MFEKTTKCLQFFDPRVQESGGSITSSSFALIKRVINLFTGASILN